MRKLVMATVGLFIFVAGIMVGGHFDLPQNAKSYSAITSQTGQLQLLGGYYDVQWNGAIVKVYNEKGNGIGVSFTREEHTDGSVTYYNLRGRQ